MKELYIWGQSIDAVKELEDEELSDLEKVLGAEHFKKGYAVSAGCGMITGELKLSPKKYKDKSTEFVFYLFELKDEYLKKCRIRDLYCDAEESYEEMTIEEKEKSRAKYTIRKSGWTIMEDPVRGSFLEKLHQKIQEDIIMKTGKDWYKEFYSTIYHVVATDVPSSFQMIREKSSY